MYTLLTFEQFESAFLGFVSVFGETSVSSCLDTEFFGDNTTSFIHLELFSGETPLCLHTRAIPYLSSRSNLQCPCHSFIIHSVTFYFSEQSPISSISDSSVLSALSSVPFSALSTVSGWHETSRLL